MKDKILESYLADFVKEFALQDLPSDNIFEYFVNYCIVSREHPEDFELEQVSVGGDHDSAIDGIAILVNEHIVSSKEDIDYFKKMLRRFDVKFIFIQSKTSPKFESGEIGNFLFGIRSFFEGKPLIKENPDIQKLRELKDYIYQSSIDMDVSPICNMYYVTTGKWANDPQVNSRIEVGIQEIKQSGLFSDVKFFTYDAEKLRNVYRELRLKIIKEVTFEKHTILPRIDNVQEAYIGILPCKEYLKLIKDSDGNMLYRVFYDNVRDFQGNNPVNMEIEQTLKNISISDRFCLLNNGITIVAGSINKVADTFKLKDFQIVNGCQTSHILFRNQKDLTDKIFIPVKLIVTDDIEVTNQVIKATNRQTEVKLEAFEALSPFQKVLEEFYNTFGKDKSPRIYYERRSKQYESLPISKQQVITLTAQIKSFIAMFLNEPHSTHRYYGELLAANRNRIFLENHSPFPYYLSGYAYCKIEQLFNDKYFSRFYRKFKYQMLLLFRTRCEPFEIPYLNSKKIVDYCEHLLAAQLDEESAKKIFQWTISIIDKALTKSGQAPSDAVRLRAFTSDLLEIGKTDEKRKETAEGRVERQKGTVISFSDIRGFGFIRNQKGQEFFVHYSGIRGPGYRTLKVGQEVDFTIIETPRGIQAKDVNII
ncbi:MAG: AIPR protein [Deltaproteobacteria bacterium]|nr:AIPR protein [Deltaproteobacteria bacterium]